mgnify:CR=1 FL=1
MSDVGSLGTVGTNGDLVAGIKDVRQPRRVWDGLVTRWNGSSWEKRHRRR